MKNVAEFGKKWYKEIRKKGVNEVIIYCCLRLFAGDNVYLMRKNEVIAKIDVDSIVDIKPSSGWYL